MEDTRTTHQIESDVEEASAELTELISEWMGILTGPATFAALGSDLIAFCQTEYRATRARIDDGTAEIASRRAAWWNRPLNEG